MSKKQDKKKGSGYINHGVVAENRRARHEYEIIETIEAGMILKGTEVKSLRKGRAQINEAYAGEKDGKLVLFNAHIAEWEGGNRFNHEERRVRELLVKGRERKQLKGMTQAKGMTLVPLKLYFNDRGIAKLLLGVAKGRREHEKRDVVKERDWNREKERIMKDKW